VSLSEPDPLLPDEVCGEIGKQFQLTLVELIALSLAGKQLQWTCYGREFDSVHHQLGRLVDEWRTLEDLIAARAAAIGMALDGSASAVIELDDHRPLEPGFTEAGAAVERLCAQLWDVAVRVRERATLLSSLDAVSHHVLIDAQGKLEDQLWMLRAQLSD
jgi:starvation-inducible DNA-binding protein